MSGAFAGPSHQRDLLKAAFHHPLEIVAQKTVNGKNVVCSLMIGHKHIACVGVDQLAPAHLHTHQSEPAHNPGPYLGRIVAPPATSERNASCGCYHGRDYGDRRHQRQHDQ